MVDVDEDGSGTVEGDVAWGRVVEVEVEVDEDGAVRLVVDVDEGPVALVVVEDDEPTVGWVVVVDDEVTLVDVGRPWQTPVPASVKVFPAWGRNRQS